MKPSTSSIKTDPHVIGADVAKAFVVIHDSVSGRTTTIANTQEALVEALSVYGPGDLLVCEVTGGYELATLQAALSVGLAAHRADAARVKNFIKSHGGIAKTDKIDARWLARYGQERGSTLGRWEARSADRDALASLVRHRSDLVKLRVQALNRRSAPAVGRLAPFLDEQITFLDGHIKEIETAIKQLIAQIDHLATDQKKLQTLYGLGPVNAPSLLALMPELGTLGRRQVASLGAMAPHPVQSGTNTKRTRTRGGRTELRPILFMAALTAFRCDPKMKAFAQRLSKAGKPKRVVLNAIARKILVAANAILRPENLKVSHA